MLFAFQVKQMRWIWFAFLSFFVGNESWIEEEEERERKQEREREKKRCFQFWVCLLLLQGERNVEETILEAWIGYKAKNKLIAYLYFSVKNAFKKITFLILN